MFFISPTYRVYLDTFYNQSEDTFGSMPRPSPQGAEDGRLQGEFAHITLEFERLRHALEMQACMDLVPCTKKVVLNTESFQETRR
jgi:hypothetical protein